MLKEYGQTRMELSPYQNLYDMIIPPNHLLRRLKENIDFSFVNPMLKKQYCEHYGRPAKEPEMMFKLLFLKKIYDLSDERVISSAQTDMAYKYFLGLSPEDQMADPSLLTKFRKTRITEDILEELLKETIQQAIKKGLVKSGTIIVDATHVEAAVQAKSVPQVLRELTKSLRKEIYKYEYDLSERFPDKPSLEADVSEEIAYTYRLLGNVREGVEQSGNQAIKELYQRIKDLLDTDRIRKIRSKDDEDARFGHKTPTKKFFGYKTHIAMSDDRIITGIEVTDGARPDGLQLPKLIENCKKNGVTVKEVVGRCMPEPIQRLQRQPTQIWKMDSATAKTRICCNARQDIWQRGSKTEKPPTEIHTPITASQPNCVKNVLFVINAKSANQRRTHTISPSRTQFIRQD